MGRQGHTERPSSIKEWEVIRGFKKKKKKKKGNGGKRQGSRSSHALFYGFR